MWLFIFVKVYQVVPLYFDFRVRFWQFVWVASAFFWLTLESLCSTIKYKFIWYLQLSTYATRHLVSNLIKFIDCTFFSVFCFFCFLRNFDVTRVHCSRKMTVCVKSYLNMKSEVEFRFFFVRQFILLHCTSGCF